MADIKPTTKKVSEIEGVFVVPSYQREIGRAHV